MILGLIRNWRSKRPGSQAQVTTPGGISLEGLMSAFATFLETKDGQVLGTFVGRLPAGWSVYLLGGIPRGLLLSTPERPPIADFDLVIGGCRSTEDLFQSLFKVFGRTRVQRNRFGGAKLVGRAQEPTFDVWRLEDHLVSRGTPAPATIENLLPHCLSNLDSIAIDVRRRHGFDGGALEGLTRRRVSLLHEPVADPPALVPQFVHLLLLWEQFEARGYSFTDAFLRVFRDSIDAAPTSILLREVEEKLRERRVQGVDGILSRINGFLGTVRLSSASPVARG